MMSSLRRRSIRALTLLEVMIVIAVIGVLLALVAPSMQEMIGMQRLRSINSQLITDVNFARSEALSRNQFLGVVVRNVSTEPMSCYVLFTSSVNPLVSTALDPSQCNCTNNVGAACGGTQREVRTVQVPRSLSIQLRTPTQQPKWFAYNPINGGMENRPAGSSEIAGNEFCVEVTRTPRGRLRTSISISGRASICTPDGSVPGVELCPAYSAVARNCLSIP